MAADAINYHNRIRPAVFTFQHAYLASGLCVIQTQILVKLEMSFRLLHHNNL